jgi:hypothetical protein
MDSLTSNCYLHRHMMKKSSRKSRAEPVVIDWKSVGQRIRELRRFDMTQEELGCRLE